MKRYSNEELETRLWAELKGTNYAFVGLFNDPHGDVPMTLVTDGDARRGIWIFTKRDNSIASGGTAMARIISKGQDVFIRLDGSLIQEQDGNKIDQLWSPFIAAWYEQGRDDPELLVLRFEIDAAEIWLAETSPMSVAKMVLGKSMAQEAEGKHAFLDIPR